MARGSIQRPKEFDTWIQTRRGFTLPFPHARNRPPPPGDYTVDYPVDPAFLSRLDPAHATVNDGFLVREVSIGGDSRRALYAPAPSEFRFPIAIPQRGMLNIGLGLLEEAWFLSDGVGFEISLRFADGSSKSLWALERNPRARSQHRRWAERLIDLSADAGKQAELVLRTHAGPQANADFDFAAFAEPILYQVPPDPTPIVIVDLDTLRADHLQVYGYSRETSPELLRFARDAVVFEQAISQAPWTLPSQLSILTGQYPATHQVRGLDQRLPASAETLARVLAKAGYLTRALTDGGIMSSEFGFDNGFDSYTQTERHRADYLPGFMRRFRKWFDTWTAENFFVLLHTYETHDPYDPPATDLHRFDPNYAGTIFERFSYEQIVSGEGPSETTARERAHLIARYDGEIRYTDRFFGELMEELKNRDLYDRALIAVVSDHGDELNEHGGWLHGDNFHDELLHVPLLIKFPSGTIPTGRVAQQVEMVDLMPTLLDYLDIPMPSDLDGRSLMPLLLPSGEGGMTPEAWAAGDEYAISDRLGSEGVSVRTARHKLVQRGSERDFFDLSDDPGELRDRYDPSDPVVQKFVAVLESYLATEGTVALRKQERLEPDVENQLRALGYVK